MNEYVGLALSFAYLGIVLLISLKLQKLPFEFSRKFVHILAANWWFIAVYAFHSPWMASIVPFFFVIFNSVTYFFGWIPSINKRDGQRNFGTIYYAVSTLFLTFISFQPGALQTVGGLGILVMGYGDGLASLVGRKWGNHPFQIFQAKKSFEGSATMFLVSFIVIYTYLNYATGNAAIGACLLVASVATLVEAICPWGLDNLLVPMMTSFVYFVYML